MENNKTARLSEVNVSNVSLPELVRFFDEVEKEFPLAIKIISKRLLNNVVSELPEGEYKQQVDTKAVVSAMAHLEADMQQQMASTLVLSLHKTFGFGKVRVLRLLNKAQSMLDDKDAMNVESLVNWCEARGIDCNEIFAAKVNQEGYFVRNEVAAAKEESND